MISESGRGVQSSSKIHEEVESSIWGVSLMLGYLGSDFFFFFWFQIEVKRIECLFQFWGCFVISQFSTFLGVFSSSIFMFLCDPMMI